MNNNLYNYIFWFNCYEEVWYAIDKNYQSDFFNGKREKLNFHKSENINTLIEIINKPHTD